jgi:hypothetical protein
MRKVYLVPLGPIFAMFFLVCFFCPAAHAQSCISYYPNPATFPFFSTLGGAQYQTVATVTQPDGTVSQSTQTAPIPASGNGSVQWGNPQDYANLVFGSAGNALFQSCGGIFPSAGPASATPANPDFSETVTVSSSAGNLQITDQGIIDTNLNCPTGVTCPLNQGGYTLTYIYSIPTGSYTITVQSNQHLVSEYANGVTVDSVTTLNGTASGAWPLQSALTIASTLPPGQAGMPYPASGKAALVTGGTPPYDAPSLIGPLSDPAKLGLTFDPATGNVSGMLLPTLWGPYTISGIVGDSGTPPGLVTGSATLNVTCGITNGTWSSYGRSGPGDDRDALLTQYYTYGPFGIVQDQLGRPFNPNCAFVTQSVSPDLNVGSDQRYLDVWMVFDAELPLLNGWLSTLNSMEPPPIGPPRTVTGGYRTPINQFLCCTATRSQHMFGKAIDINTESKTDLADYQAVRAAAFIAATEAGLTIWVEPWDGNAANQCQPGLQACVHADVRYDAGEYVTP